MESERNGIIFLTTKINQTTKFYEKFKILKHYGSMEKSDSLLTKYNEMLKKLINSKVSPFLRKIKQKALNKLEIITYFRTALNRAGHYNFMNNSIDYDSGKEK